MRNLRTSIACGIAAAGIAAGVSRAEDAGPARRPAEQCSFLGCLLHGGADGSSERTAAATPAPPPNPADAKAADAPGQAAAGAPVGDAAATKPVKPAATVTIAADVAEKTQLKKLAAAEPGHRLRIVAPDSREAELTLAPALDAASDSHALPLYSEQLHVLAGSTVTSLADLRDKQVSFGPAGGAAEVIARRAFAAAGVTVKETPLDASNALDGLATGDLAAVAILAPQPAPAIAKLRAPGLHLVEWPEGAALPVGARLQLLKVRSYPRLAKEEIHVVAVDGVLTLTARGEKSAAARGFFAMLKQRTASLAHRGFDRLGSREPTLRQGRAVAKDRRR